MCGIFGVIGAISDLAPADIYTSFDRLRGRGPDRSLSVHNPEYFLGFHRLAINGIEIDGDQPFYLVDGDRTFYLLCNGEIYNFRELIDEYGLKVPKQGSDCAVLLPLFRHFGYNLTLLNQTLIGEYSFAIIELRDHALVAVHLSTDPLSVRPVFFAVNASNTVFGFSSLLAGLCDHFERVQRIPQKTIVKWTPGEIPRLNSYWPSVKNEHPETVSEPSDADFANVVEVFEQAVRRRLIADRPIGCLLSGGLDSSLVCAVAARILHDDYPGKKLRTFSIGMKEGTDIGYAQQVADHVQSLYGNIEHTSVYFTPEEGLAAIDQVLEATETYDITTIRASVGQYLLGRYISANTDIKVVLNGDGADEEQMGYLYFFNRPDQAAAQADSYRLLDEIHLFDGLRVDRAISCHGLEARVPFLDREVVDYFRSLPASWKTPGPGQIEKHFIRSAFDKVYAGQPILPSEVLWRKKEAFSDGVSGKERSWFRIVQEYLDAKVSDDEFTLQKAALHPGIIPPSKEAFYFMRSFQRHFGNQWQVIPHYWLPRWSGDAQEPSARVLPVYDAGS